MGPGWAVRGGTHQRLRLVSKSHLTLTWGSVMNQHDLRFAMPCSCLIESSVAHPPYSDLSLRRTEFRDLNNTHYTCQTCITLIKLSIKEIPFIIYFKPYLPSWNKSYLENEFVGFARAPSSLTLVFRFQHERRKFPLLALFGSGFQGACILETAREGTSR